jgi:hypothetical protein
MNNRIGRWQCHHTSVGYRQLAVDYRSGSYVFDTALSGPIMGVSYKF